MEATWTAPKRFRFSMTLSTTVEPSLPLATVLSAWAIRKCRLPDGCISPSNEAPRWSMTKCVQAFDGTNAAKCPHPLPWCPTSFESAQKRSFHLQDVHCIEFTKGIKCGRSDSETEIKAEDATDRTEKRRRTNKVKVMEASPPELKIAFINENVKTFLPMASDPPAPGRSAFAANLPAKQGQMICHMRSPSVMSFTGSMATSLVMDWAIEEAATATKTSASSIYCEIFPNLDP